MLRTICVLGVAGLLALTPSARADEEAAAAKPKAKHGAKALFKKLDTNHDGKLSREEFAKIGEHLKKKPDAKGKGKKLEKLFTKLDANNDGFLSPEEFKKLGELKKKKKGEDK